MQCAAVSTHCGWISVPRQLRPPVPVMYTDQGWLRSKSVPVGGGDVPTGAVGAVPSTTAVVVRRVTTAESTAVVPTSATAPVRDSAPVVDDTSVSSDSLWVPQPASCSPASAPNSSSDVSDLNVGVFIS